MNTNSSTNGGAFGDHKQRVLTDSTHPVDLMEPLLEEIVGNIPRLAMAAGVLNYLFPTSNLKDTFTRVVLLAHAVHAELYNLRTRSDVARHLKVSDQAIDQMFNRVRNSIITKPVTKETDGQGLLPLFDSEPVAIEPKDQAAD